MYSLKGTFDRALKDLKVKWAAGIDEIQAELWKKSEENLMNEVLKFNRGIYRTNDQSANSVKSFVTWSGVISLILNVQGMYYIYFEFI